jgi:hypothetical protein
MSPRRRVSLDRFTRHAAFASLLLCAALPATMGVSCCTTLYKGYPPTRPATQPDSSPATAPAGS